MGNGTSDLINSGTLKSVTVVMFDSNYGKVDIGNPY